MKQLFFASALAIGAIGCSDSSTKESKSASDSAAHSEHQAQPTPQSTTDTVGMGGKDMLSMMNSMMASMKSIQSTGNPDNDFASLMKAHHLGAIEMAEVEAARGGDPQVKQMAQKMVADQQKEVAAFNSFLSGHNAHGGGEAFFKEATSAMDNMKMDMDHSASIDRQFVQMMIPHHQSAIDMAQVYIKSGAHEQKLKTIAGNIISSQQKEITELKSWLAKNK